MATHPEPVAAVTAVTVALSASAGRSPRGCLAAGGAALAGQLSVGWCNDVVDRRRDTAAGRPDKPIARGDVSPALGAGSALAALGAAVPLSLLSGRRAAAAHLVAVGLGWGYDLGLKGTAASVVPYAGAFGLLPCFVALGLPGAPAPRAWAVAGAALLGSGAHFANALPDLGDDLAAGVLGLPQRMGGARSRMVAASALTASSLLLALGPGRPGRLVVVGAASAVVLGVLGSSAGTSAPSDPGASRLPFRATMAVAVLDVALLIGRGRALVRPSADGAAQ